MKYFLILGATFFASVSSAQAIECAAELPAARSAYWSYRIIDGRKCWYEGRPMLPKAMLRWPDASLPKTQLSKSQLSNSQANAQARMRVIDSQDFLDPEDGSCCWPPLSHDDGFETRWRALFEIESAGIGSRK
jgi:hypothetical protein